MPDIQTALKSALSRTLQEWDDDDGGIVIHATPAQPSIQPVSTSLSTPSQTMQTTQQAPTKARTFAPRNNVSRVTFNYVRDNPGSTRKEIMIALEHLGFAEKSVSALLSQMVQNKMAHATNGLYYTDVPEYTPIKSGRSLKLALAKAARKAAAEQRKAEKAAAKAAEKKTYTKKPSAGIAALQATMESLAVPSQPVAQADAPKHFLTKLVRTKSPEEIIENMTVYQARELYMHLKSMFGN